MRGLLISIFDSLVFIIQVLLNNIHYVQCSVHTCRCPIHVNMPQITCTCFALKQRSV